MENKQGSYKLNLPEQPTGLSVDVDNDGEADPGCKCMPFLIGPIFTGVLIVLLVGQACFSACELEAYGFSQVPGVTVVGETSTAGVEAKVARSQFIMPEAFFLQFPAGRFKLPDGSLFLEGVGVPPTVKVPVDETTVFSEEDVVLQAAFDLILGQ